MEESLMSIMGMREWFRKNRVVMVVVFVLLLVGLLISYGRFGSSGTVTTADYEKMVEQAREAYAADPTAPENVYYMYQTLAQYVQVLNSENKDENAADYAEVRAQIDALDQEAVGYYDEYYALLSEEAKKTYQAEPNYANAYMVAQYLVERYRAQASMEGMEGGVAMQAEANNWLVLAMGHRVDDVTAELAENPTDSAILYDLADAKGALAYYQHEQDANFDMRPVYEESLALYQQAVENCPADAEAATRAQYYVGAASCAFEMNDTALAEEYYQAAIAADQKNYNANMGYASMLLNIGRIDESLAALQAYQALIGETDENYATVQQYVDSVQSLKDQLENPQLDEDSETETEE